MEDPQLYLNFNKSLYRLTTEKVDFIFDIDPDRIISGVSTSSISQDIGLVLSGKTGFTNNETGYILGNDKGVQKFYIGTTSNYLNFDGTNVKVSGTLSAGAIDIGGSDATSFHVDADGNMWSGNAIFGSAPFRVSNAGALTATSVTITGLDADDISETGAKKWAGETGADITLNATTITDANISSINFSNISASNISATNITTGTLTGRTVQTASSGQRVVINGSSNLIDFYDSNGANQGTIYGIPTGIGITGDIDAGSVSISCNTISLGTGSGAAITFSWNNSVDIGTSSYKVRHIYVGSNIYVDGTVDGVNIASHAGNASAHHIKTTSLAHSAITGIGANNHHSSTSSGIAITPSTISTTGSCYTGSTYTYALRPRSGNSYNLGTADYHWANIYGNYLRLNTSYGGIYHGTVMTMDFYNLGSWTKLVYTADLVPPSSGQGQVGYGDQHWQYVRADYIQYDISCTAFQKHDDIQLLKNIKQIKEDKHIKDGRGVWDKKTFHKDIVKENGMTDLASMNGFLIGTMKQMVERIELLELKIQNLTK